MKAAYALAREWVATRPGTRRGGARHRLVCVHGRTVVADYALFSDPVWDAFVVVGRHDRCGIVLRGDSGVSGRHLFVQSVALPSDAPALRIVDLRTSRGFALVDGSTQTSIFAAGPIVVGLGEHVVVAFPSGPKGEPLPRALPELDIMDSSDEHDRISLFAPPAGPYRANARPSSSSRVTLMPRLVIPGERRRSSRPTAFALTLERGEQSAMLGISEEELGRGIIVGRSMSGISERLGQVTTDVVSRTHLLILREQGSTHAYDLASTFGVFREDAPIRWATLGRSATLVLGRGSEAVRLRWRQA